MAVVTEAIVKIVNSQLHPNKRAWLAQLHNIHNYSDQLLLVSIRSL